MTRPETYGIVSFDDVLSAGSGTGMLGGTLTIGDAEPRDILFSMEYDEEGDRCVGFGYWSDDEDPEWLDNFDEPTEALLKFAASEFNRAQPNLPWTFSAPIKPEEPTQ